MYSVDITLQIDVLHRTDGLEITRGGRVLGNTVLHRTDGLEIIQPIMLDCLHVLHRTDGLEKIPHQ